MSTSNCTIFQPITTATDVLLGEHQQQHLIAKKKQHCHLQFHRLGCPWQHFQHPNLGDLRRKRSWEQFKSIFRLPCCPLIASTSCLIAWSASQSRSLQIVMMYITVLSWCRGPTKMKNVSCNRTMFLILPSTATSLMSAPINWAIIFFTASAVSLWSSFR